MLARDLLPDNAGLSDPPTSSTTDTSSTQILGLTITNFIKDTVLGGLFTITPWLFNADRPAVAVAAALCLAFVAAMYVWWRHSKHRRGTVKAIQHIKVHGLGPPKLRHRVAQD